MLRPLAISNSFRVHKMTVLSHQVQEMGRPHREGVQQGSA